MAKKRNRLYEIAYRPDKDSKEVELSLVIAKNKKRAKAIFSHGKPKDDNGIFGTTRIKLGTEGIIKLA